MKIRIFLGFLFVILLFVSFWFVRQKSTTNSDKLQVTASFYPLYEFAKQVGADKIEVRNMTPAGAEPHDFDPSPADLVYLNHSKILIYNGGVFEPWVPKVLPDLEKKSIIIVKAGEEVEFDDDDPHIWLDPLLAIKMVENIKKAFVKADPDHETYYASNAKAYEAKLSDLDRRYKEGLSNCESSDVISSHKAFHYLAKRYNLNIVSLAGLTPDDEPSPQKLAQIANLARTRSIKYIYFETLVSPKLADALAREIRAKTLVFNPAEGLTDAQMQQGIGYISIQLENLDNLKTALQCK